MNRSRLALFALVLVASSLQLTGVASAADGTVSGTISKSGGGTAGAGQVSIIAFTSAPSSGGTAQGSTQTDASGNYSLSLPAGTYRLLARANSGSALATGWIGASGALASDFAGAEAQPISNDTSRPGRNVTLNAGGSIRGTLTGPDAALTADDVTVRVYPSTADDPFDAHYSATNSAGGTYDVAGIPLGTYKVLFHVTGSRALATKWAGGASVIADAQTYTISAGGDANRTTVDATLTAGGKITGRIFKSGGAAVGENEVCVNVYSIIHGATIGDVQGQACTGSDGRYSVNGLSGVSPTNRFRVLFSPNEDTSLNARSEWYDDSDTYAEADAVIVTTTGVSGIDATLADGAPAIEGEVKRASGNTLVGAGVVCVEALESVTGADWAEHASFACTDSGGEYALRGLETGKKYRLRYVPQPGSGLAAAWHGGASTYRTATEVSPGSDLTVSLAAGFEISGTVSRSSGTVTSNTVCVSAFKHVAGADFGPWVAGTCVSGGGAYTLSGLAADSYRLEFAARAGSGLSTRWSGDKPNYREATAVAVSADVTGQNIQLPAGASISGTISGSSGTVGLGVVCVGAVTVVSGANWGEHVASTCTNPDGTYELAGLPAATATAYKLFFQPNAGQPSASGLKAEWYNDKNTYAVANSVTTSVASPAEDIDATLGSGVSISGTVSGPNGAVGRDHVCVNAMTIVSNANFGEWAGGSCTNESGGYSITGLPPGKYKLSFEARPGSNLQSRWLGDVTRYEQATETTASSSVTGVNMTLASGAAITGTVSKTGGGTATAGQVCVGAITIVSGAGHGDHVGGACTRSNGTYSIGGLPAGSYRLIFQPQAGSNLRGAWSGNKATYDAATAVATGTTSNITLDAGVSISGTVSQPGSGSTPATVGTGQVCVSAFESVSGAHWGAWAGGACTDSDGEYTIAGLAASTSYRIEFRPQTGSSLRFEWHSDKRNYETATAVSTGTSGLTGVNATLDTGVSISGTVSKSGGTAGAQDVCVGAFTVVTGGTWGEMVGGSCTNGSGFFSIDGLTSGVSYKLGFQAQPQSGLLSEWYNDQATYQAATSVAAPSTTANITLSSGGTITGSVTSGGGTAVGANAVCVSAFTDTGSAGSWGVWRGGTCTRSDGAYTISGLPTGTNLRLRFEPQNTTMAGEWWDNATTYAAATSVTTSDTARNADLASGGEIAAPVTWSAGGTLCMAARPSGGNGDSWRAAACLVLTANVQSTIRLTGLPAASYEVVFWNSASGTGSARWYDSTLAGELEADAPDSFSGSLVPVSVGLASTLDAVTFS